MRLRHSLTLSVGALLVASCASGTTEVVGDFCDVADPLLYDTPDVADYVVTHDPLLADDIAAHNLYGEETCGWSF